MAKITLSAEDNTLHQTILSVLNSMKKGRKVDSFTVERISHHEFRTKVMFSNSNDEQTVCFRCGYRATYKEIKSTFDQRFESLIKKEAA